MFFWINEKWNIFLIGLGMNFTLIIFYLLITILYGFTYNTFNFIFNISKIKKIRSFCSWICVKLIWLWEKILNDQMLLTQLISFIFILIIWFWSIFDYYNAKSFILVLVKKINYGFAYFSGLTILVAPFKIYLFFKKRNKKIIK